MGTTVYFVLFNPLLISHQINFKHSIPWILSFEANKMDGRIKILAFNFVGEHFVEWIQVFLVNRLTISQLIICKSRNFDLFKLMRLKGASISKWVTTFFCNIMSTGVQYSRVSNNNIVLNNHWVWQKFFWWISVGYLIRKWRSNFTWF